MRVEGKWKVRVGLGVGVCNKEFVIASLYGNDESDYLLFTNIN